MSDKIWAEGLFVDRRETAPDFVVCRLGIDRERFIAWLQKQPVSERGYLNINVTRSRDGQKMSASLDTWKPQQARSEAGQYQGGGRSASAEAYRAASGGRAPVIDFDDDPPF